MEVSKDQMKMFAAGSNNEGTKILSRIGDDKNVNEGNGRGSFKEWVSAIVDESMGCETEVARIGADVELKV